MSFMCFITSESGKKDDSPRQMKVHQIIEALAYEKANARARIMLDCWVENSGPDGAELLLVHPGKATLEEKPCFHLLKYPELQKTTVRLESEKLTQENMLFFIYAKRLKFLPDSKSGFSRRLNCYRQEDIPTFMDNDCAGLQFTTGTLSEDGKTPNYTVIKVSGIKKGKTWFRVVVLLENRAYQQFVGEQPHFWIEGPSKVEEFIKSAIKADLAMQNSDGSKEWDFFEHTICSNIIYPDAYDIVVFRKGVEGMDSDIFCDAITSDVYLAHITDPIAEKHAYLYVSRSPDFWIDVCYADDQRLLPLNKTMSLDKAATPTTAL